MFKNRSKVVFVSLVLGVIYLVYILSHFGGSVFNSTEATEQVASVIATALVAPHMFLLGLAVLFNAIAFFANKKWACITALVLYCVSGLLFLLYVFFLIPMIVLSAVGIGKIKKISESTVAVSS